MSHLDKIFDVWAGNAESMAADIGESGVTVRQWRNRGSIHSDHWPKIITAAWDKRGTLLRLEDFVPPDIVAQLPVVGARPAGEQQTAGDGVAVEVHGTDHNAADTTPSATKAGENICSASGGQGVPHDGAPFISPTCSPTNGSKASSADSPGCSTAGADKAAA
jgi:hypothetical protein